MKQTLQPRIFATGLIALDVVFGQDSPESPRFWAGGTCGNVVTILSFLGWNAFPVSRLKSDPISSRIKVDFERWGVNWDLMETGAVAPAPVVVERIKKRPDGSLVHRFSFKCPDCGKWFPSFRPLTNNSAREVAEKVQEPTVFFFDRVSPGIIVLAKACAEKGAIIVFEPNSVTNKKLEQEALSVAHILKYSAERVATFEDVPPNVMLQIETLGHEGLRYRTQLKNVRQKGWAEMLPINVSNFKDAAGSGDWCTAGLVHRLCGNGKSSFKHVRDVQLKEGLHFGQVLAAWNCRFEGARGGMYRVSRRQFKTEIEALLAGSSIQVFADEPNELAQEILAVPCAACKENRR
jgi:sugar/nucleoside kinase (ribokinase family)